MLGLAGLALAALLAFAALFAYQYYKPKYGGLVVKTTPPGAAVSVDGKARGISPITIGDLRSGGHKVTATKEGYRDLIQQVEVMPYATENLHWTLEPIVPQLSNEQLAEVESYRKKLDSAQRENILLPPPDDYNVLYFINKILAIDPAQAYALEVRAKLVDSMQQAAEQAYSRENWLEAEKQYKNLALIFPNDISINERLSDIAAKIDASVRDREEQIADWQTRVEAAFKAGTLVPPEKDNALEAIRSIQRLDRNNENARSALQQLKEMLQNRGDSKIAGGDWHGARNEFRSVLQYFPPDEYTKSRMALVEGKLSELAQAEQQSLQRTQEEQQLRMGIANLRQSAIGAYRSGAYPRAIAEWQEYLKLEPNSDEAYYYIGASNLDQKQFDTAILNFERCLSINANNGPAQLELGLLYDRHRNDLNQALEHLRKAKEIGGIEKYSSERLQGMIQNLQERMQLQALQKIPFAAEHKHAFSSCRGSLRITDDGVEYRTTETDHSFYETYSNLRSFAVTGDEISIRTQSNKKYNFRLLAAGDGARIRRLASHHNILAN
jgi:tetratricopeptide (TPR) repeat protein